MLATLPLPPDSQHDRVASTSRHRVRGRTAVGLLSLRERALVCVSPCPGNMGGAEREAYLLQPARGDTPILPRRPQARPPPHPPVSIGRPGRHCGHFKSDQRRGLCSPFSKWNESQTRPGAWWGCCRPFSFQRRSKQPIVCPSLSWMLPVPWPVPSGRGGALIATWRGAPRKWGGRNGMRCKASTPRGQAVPGCRCSGQDRVRVLRPLSVRPGWPDCGIARAGLGCPVCPVQVDWPRPAHEY